ncbi:hypothetical protein [Flavobacterium sp. W20_MBD1_R3]|uniref:hypothetical protein n=1 Tax=Flavobacterium sp. W20_MBD1_R3 TaxID=3240278 RepID=UPI003F93B710
MKLNHYVNSPMKKYITLFLILFLTSCQVTETIHLEENGSGEIEVSKLREEYSYMQLLGEDYSTEEIFQDTTYVFKDLIAKYSETFSRLPAFEKAIFQKFNTVIVHLKKSSFEKEFSTAITQNFSTIEEVADLYKTEEYADDIENNYALVAEEHYYSVFFTFDGNTFKRIVKITDAVELKKQQEEIERLKIRFSKFKAVQNFILKYHFPRKIKSVSNPDVKISDDKKSLELQFLIADCLVDPESTNLEVILE